MCLLYHKAAILFKSVFVFASCKPLIKQQHYVLWSHNNFSLFTSYQCTSHIFTIQRQIVSSSVSAKEIIIIIIISGICIKRGFFYVGHLFRDILFFTSKVMQLLGNSMHPGSLLGDTVAHVHTWANSVEELYSTANRPQNIM